MVPLQVWGNHHCLHTDEFRKTLSRLISRKRKFNEPIYHLKTDQRLTAKIINKVKISLLKNNKEAQVHVFILGDIDLLQGKSAQDLCDNFCKLAETTQLHPSSHFVICSVISSNISGPDSSAELANKKLHKKLSKREQITFIKVHTKLSEDDFESHQELNSYGATKLAQFVAKALDSIPKFNNVRANNLGIR